MDAESQGPLPLQNELPASTFQACVTLIMQEPGKAKRKAATESFFRPLSCSNCFTSQMSDLQTCSTG